MKIKLTKEEKLANKILTKEFNSLMKYLFSEYITEEPPEEEVLYKIRYHEKLKGKQIYISLLQIFDIEYIVSKDAGEYHEFYWLQKDFTCVFITNNAM